MKELLNSITKKQWLVVGVAALGMIIITAAPYVYGYFSAPERMVYTGLHHLTPGDTNVFMSMIEQTKQGHSVFLNLYTSEAQSRVFINPLWLSVGWLAAAFDMPNLLALHVARSLAIIGFVVVAYLFISYIFRDHKKRVWALLILLLSSGVGVFFNPALFDPNDIEEHPVDMWVPESITFLTLYHTPHITASLTLIVAVFFLMMIAFKTDRYRYSIAAGLAALFLFWFHPFNGPTVYAVLIVFAVVWSIKKRAIQWHYLYHGMVMSVIAAPSVGYLYLISRADPAIRLWSEQNILNSPSIGMYIIGYGFLLPLALYAAVKVCRKMRFEQVFLVVWMLTTAVLIYVPVDFQRRMVEGLHVPISLLALMGVYIIVRRFKTAPGIRGVIPVFLVMGLIIFLPLSNMQIVGQDFWLYATKKGLPYYLTQNEVDAFHWLRDHTGEREVIFSSFYTGNYIPAYTGRIVWIGHGPQTLFLPDKMDINEWFWESDAESRAKYRLLKHSGVRFVVYGQKEKEMGSFVPAHHSYLTNVFENADIAVYEVL